MKKLSKLLFGLLLFIFVVPIFQSDANAKSLKRTSWVSENPLNSRKGEYYLELYFHKNGDLTMILKYMKSDTVKISHGMSYSINRDTLIFSSMVDKPNAYMFKWINDSRILISLPGGDEYFKISTPDIICELCGGGGGCKYCRGMGQTRANYGRSHTCTTCNGDGKCHKCKGTGYLKL